MASEALKTIVAGLQAANPIQGETVLEMRASMEALAAAAPLPEDVALEEVDAGGVPAEWTTAAGARVDRALIYFHGGGYCMGSIASHRGLTANLSRSAGLRVLNVGYRLAPEHPYPAALEDAVAAYRFALDQGLAGAHIALAGDSAGGGLALAALIAIRDQGLPLPGAAAGLSPWTDLAATGDSIQTKAQLDPFVEQESLGKMAAAYLGGANPKQPLASPLYADFQGLPPLLLQVGSAEILMDDAVRVADRARAAGVDAECRVWEEMIHVWHAFAPILPEAQQAVEEIADFLTKQLG